MLLSVKCLLMMIRVCLLLCILLPLVTPQDDDFLYDVFPPDFLWGTATSSYQIEGAWDADGKGENIWDRYTHEGHVSDNQTGDVACNSYYQYMDDVATISNLQVHFYRFSLSWARILPNGTLAGGINQPGIDYYNNLINGLIGAGIEPMITLYHWDLPQALQDIGGWENEQIVQHFTDFAGIAFSNFGDRVGYWLTFNEPWVVCHLGYGIGLMAPGIVDPSTGAYRTAHNILKSHGEAYHLYNNTYKPTQGGILGITLNSEWREPFTDDPLDIEAADLSLQFYIGWFAHPIYSSAGDYPPTMRAQVDMKSEAQGFPESRLPYFTPEEVVRIRGTYDYFGLNHYTTAYAVYDESNINCTTYVCDQDTFTFRNSSWPGSGSFWLRSVPWGLRRQLGWVKEQYGDVPIYITENGVSDRNITTDDDARITYYRDYINNVLKAVVLDGVNVKAYTAWSLMDNFEWRAGYHERFGINYIDFDNDPGLVRTPKESALAYTQIILDNGFPPPPAQDDDDVDF